jgi:hypothetical protein
MVGDIERAFSRQGSEVHLSELRAGVLPLYVTLPVAFVSGFLLSLFPWALGIFLRLVLAVTSQGNAVEAPPPYEDASFISVLTEVWPYGVAFGAACIAASLLRRYSARRNKYLVLTVGQFAEFRVSYGELGTAIGIAAVLLAMSQTARDLSIMVIILSPIAGMLLQDLQDWLLRTYSQLTSNQVAENVYSVWEIVCSREEARGTKLHAVGARCGGRVLVVNGVVSDEMTLDFFSRLPNMIHGVERVILNGQELQCRPPMHPKGTS